MVIDTKVNGPFMMARCAAPVIVKAGWSRIINISMNHETMRRAGFSPYGPSKAALESETIIWSQDLADTSVTVNALLTGGATFTGMISENVSDKDRNTLLDPEIVVPPLLWLVCGDSDGMIGRRLVANRWRTAIHGREAAHAAMEEAGW
jgi:NAD(P)-dependent dehydrogenase (short-subunit alcohol dehydrogenase family)